MKVITINNKKGGVGKSTTTQSIAAALNQKSKKVLVIDCDPQQNTSISYGYQNEKRDTIFSFFTEEATLEECIRHTPSGIDLIPSRKSLAGADQFIQDSSENILCLKNAIDDLRAEDSYDFILIDTNMNQDSVLQAAYAAADEIIIPCDSSLYSVQGASDVAAMVNYLNIKYDLSIKIGGVLLIKFQNRYSVWNQAVDELLPIVSNKCHSKIYETRIPNASAVPKAQYQKTNLLKAEAKSKVAEAYTEFVNKELLGETA